jgi:hypothetical protein
LSLAIPFENWFGEAPFVFALNGSFPPFDPFLGGNDPFPPEPCRSIPFFNAFPRQNKNA